jgi:hypothetical protein
MEFPFIKSELANQVELFYEPLPNHSVDVTNIDCNSPMRLIVFPSNV